MVREISAGGVLVWKREGSWWMAVIEPAGDPGVAAQAGTETSGASSKRLKGKNKAKRVLALPKGLVDSGEKPLEAALREVYEETGITAEAITKLADTKYVYTRAWGDGQRVFKIVSFYLMQYRSGRIDDIAPAMRIEVARAFWVELEEAPKLLAYKGEKQMAQLALKYLEEHPEM
jgi:8-oxo-dGTP pyrophosphatase MutT (NUDIX family)